MILYSLMKWIYLVLPKIRAVYWQEEEVVVELGRSKHNPNGHTQEWSKSVIRSIS
jgi:hypothetical protein